MAFDPAVPSLTQLNQMMSTFTGPNTRKITDYLLGYQLGPRDSIAVIGVNGLPTYTSAADSIAYWTGDVLPATDRNYEAQVQAIRRSFTFRNVLTEGLELLADGIGADEPDWSFTVSRPLAEGEKPNAQEQALIDELEALMTEWWDKRDLPSLIQKAVILALAHGRQPLRPRIPDRFLDSSGRLTKREAAESLDVLWFVLPDAADAGIWQDPDTMSLYALTRVWQSDATLSLQAKWELSYLDSEGRTVLSTANELGNMTGKPSTPMDLGGLLWLLELTMPRAMVTPDALSQQDARNVASTALNRNTRHAVFEKTIFIGVEPPLDDNGSPKPLSGPGSESYLAPSEIQEVEETIPRSVAEPATTITRNSFYTGAKFAKLDPAEPKAIQAAIDQATADLYGILRQQFMLIAGDATASGRSRETSTGPYLRAVARCATGVEAFIRDLLTFAMRISALAQGEPNKYDSLRPVVSLHQKIFEPSSEMLTVYMALQETGTWSMQRLRTMSGVADPDAEQQVIDKEQAARQTVTTIDPTTGQPVVTPAGAPAPVIQVKV